MDELTPLGRKIEQAREGLETLKEEAREAAVRHREAGVPQAEIARRLKVDRMTVRAWLDKGRTTPDR